MLSDLAAWVDRDGNGEINYMEFISAFQLVGRSVEGDFSSAETAPVNVLDELVGNLCSFFYRHRWTLKSAFEYFDANGDGAVSPEEFSTALTALSSMAAEDGSVDFQFSPAAVERLVASFDTDGDGFIDYDEFLAALQPRDAMEM